MKFKADEIASVIQQEIEQYESQIDVREVGRVLEVGDNPSSASTFASSCRVLFAITRAGFGVGYLLGPAAMTCACFDAASMCSTPCENPCPA